MAEIEDHDRREEVRTQLHRVFEHLRTGRTDGDHALRPSEVIENLANHGELDEYITFRDNEARELDIRIVHVEIENVTGLGEDIIQDADDGGSFRSLREEMIAELTRLRQILMTDEYKDEVNALAPDERLLYDTFIASFKHCAVCGKQNHENYLRRFWFSNDPIMLEMKDMVLRLMRKLEPGQENYPSTLVAGIACCDCFSRIFKDTSESQEDADDFPPCTCRL
nr:hypothetical protein [Candidatus Sigynarchaeota archaeon]